MTVKNEVPLNETVEGIMLQFSGASIGATVQKMCPWLFDPRSENLADRDERSKSTNGVQLVAPTPRVETVHFLADLAANGWEIVNAYAQNREDPKRKGYYYCTVRFIFGHQSTITNEMRVRFGNPVIKLQRYAVEDLLKKLCSEAFWRVRGYRNPLKRTGKFGIELHNRFGISLNFEAREPLIDGNGKVVTRRAKNDQGESIGDPLPLVPDAQLRIGDLMGNG